MSAPITCHVLNTVSGTPAADLKATLTLLDAGSSSLERGIMFQALTNEDGRVKEWNNAGDLTLVAALEQFEQGAKIPWSIKFDIGPWYEAKGIETFWPEVEIKFYVKKGERHYHVPCLIGPWTYTTYRGS